ncbi:MAG: CBS domain-containing protein [Anaerolineales bacterium]|nr:CBS domain-containing protein [Chloroflexota bacterium]MBL6980785.1 CBS domain-containing protein [Anaerolineales bacterium]
MRIILTHEQTDFDGLASLLGAYLIDEQATPILPRRINRNVRGFITLYGAELPFIDPRDFRAKNIESVCLVDTQSLVTIKGVGDKTIIKVIDHHPPRENTPKTWEITTDETGANTTLLVEAIQERDLPLHTVQATLLLLGIYEDTGSLTYSRTTPRDVRAAAYLLEQGASLSIANDFLNHPLSLEQQTIYDQLREAAQPMKVHGYQVIVACGNVREMNEELSTIAHKLRDLLDPDALFMLITIRGGVQLICRSTNDNIDVAKIATHFGGGGHPRASASLIKARPIEEIHAELIDLLPNLIQPPVSVAEIMSRAPQTLPPNTPVEEALKRMQRYGYEGYPVVENGAIVGLLTRRAVDRAISHKLNLTASSLMKAGNVHVHPDHSIENLQTVMTETGWGQIPVTERDTNNILGIVTRTDLLKILTAKEPRPGHMNLSNKLETALPPARLELLKAIAEIAQQQGAALYIVGGFVRDLLLDHPSLDFDLVVEGDGIALAQAVGAEFGGRVTTHKRFGTAKWHLSEQRPVDSEQNKLLEHLAVGDSPLTSLDFITARTEFYTHPTALPTVERGSIKLDLHRRDFTINTLAMRLDGHHYGELHDYWGGLGDLQKGNIRVLHSLSFVDDPTRILRAVRYEQRYDFKIGERTLELLLEARTLLDRVSGDRIRHELDRIIEEDKARQMLDRLNELGLFEAIHKDIIWDDGIAGQIASLKAHTPEEYWSLVPDMCGMQLKRALAYVQWLIPLPIYRVQGVIKRLKLPQSLAETIRAACFVWHELPDLMNQKPSAISNNLAKTPALAIYGLHQSTNDLKARQIFEAYAKEWKHISANITGHDLRELGLSPGPTFKKILTELRNAWLDGEISTPKAEKRLLKKLIKKYTKE